METLTRVSCGTGGTGVLIHLILDEPVCQPCRDSLARALEAGHTRAARRRRRAVRP